jgi:hypothetical protein
MERTRLKLQFLGDIGHFSGESVVCRAFFHPVQGLEGDIDRAATRAIIDITLRLYDVLEFTEVGSKGLDEGQCTFVEDGSLICKLERLHEACDVPCCCLQGGNAFLGGEARGKGRCIEWGGGGRLC